MRSEMHVGIVGFPLFPRAFTIIFNLRYEVTLVSEERTKLKIE